MRAPLALVPLLLLPLVGCARCTSSPAPTGDAGPVIPLVPSVALPAPRPWKFTPVGLDVNLAPPDRCKARGPLVRAEVAPTTRFLAEPRSLSTLIVADSAPDPPRLTGVAAVTLDPAGVTRNPRPVPWFALGAVPRLARVGGTWIGGFDQTLARSDSRVGLWRDGTAEPLGRGDAFETVDLLCSGADAATRCALLTSRVSRVARPGATVWLGSPDAAADGWKPTEITPIAGDSDARPLAVVELGGAGATVALTEKSEVVFWSVGIDTAPKETARLPAPHGVIDVTALPLPVAMTFGTSIDENGCTGEPAAGGGASVKFERPGLPAAEVKAPAPPQGGFLRRLTRGAIAAWIAPLGCKRPRQVVYAVVLDEQGKPVGEPMAVGDGVSFAIATRGDDVDLYVQEAKAVTWARLTCSAP